MQISRRGFLKYCLGSAATLGLPLSVVGKLEKALAQDAPGLPKVVWLTGANCTGCTISLANRFDNAGPTDIVDLLTGYIDLAYHPNLMAAAGDLAVEALRTATSEDFILAVEGGIPTAFNGYACMLWTEDGRDITAQEAVMALAPKAAAVLSIGTCASYGGIPAGNPNPTDVRSVSELTGAATINIPGCPTHPDWIVYTVAHLLAGEVPSLDEYGRPSALFGQEIHKVCPRKGTGETKFFGDDRCLKELGCKGPRTKADCPSRMWNSKTNWCIGANSICLGCTEDGFPDKFSPFYKIEYSYQVSENDEGGEETPPTTTALEITRSEWLTDSATLTVEGKATASAVVMVSNADTGIGLGAVSADSNGVWIFTQRNPSPIPTRVRAESGDQSLVAAVENLPSEPPTQGTISKISKCEWRADRSELRVDVIGRAGSTVVFKNAISNVLLGTGTVPSDGRLKFRAQNPSPIPTRVSVVCGSRSLEANVKNAPEPTGPTQEPESAEVKISKAEWRADRSELKVDVQGTPGTVVTIFYASNGAVIGTGTIGTDERLKYRNTKLSAVPCRVRVEAAGSIMERSVENAPGDCR